MALSKVLNSTAAFLENYWSRNQVYRTAQYALMLVAGLMQDKHKKSSDKLLKIATAIADMRVLLRLMDDIPVLVHTLRTLKSCKATRNDNRFLSNLVEFINSLSGQLYYPVEHIAWAADNRLVPISSSSFWTLGVVLWGLSLVISLFQAAQRLVRINHELFRLQNRSNPESPRKKVTFQDETIEPASTVYVQSLKSQRLIAVFTLVQSLADLMNAIHWLPEGFLWAGKLPLSWIGFFGTVSSLIGLYKILPSTLP